MHKSDSFREEQVLADRLRREAAAGRPEFSETLHQQLCCAIRRCEATKPAAAPNLVSGRLLRHGVVAAIAALVVLAVSVTAWRAIKDDHAPGSAVNPSLARPGGPVRPLPAPAPEGAQVAADAPVDLDIVSDLADHDPEEIGTWVKSTVTQQYWGYLDQKSKLALEAVNNRVPLDAVASLVFADASTDP